MDSLVADEVYKGKTFRKVKHLLHIDDTINYLTSKTNYSYSINSDLLNNTLNDLVELSNSSNLQLMIKNTKLDWLKEKSIFDTDDKLENIYNIVETLRQQLKELIAY